MSAPSCDRCGGPTTIEDQSDAYGQVTWICRAYPKCRGSAMTGPSDWEIYAREQGVRW